MQSFPQTQCFLREADTVLNANHSSSTNVTTAIANATDGTHNAPSATNMNGTGGSGGATSVSQPLLA